MSLWTKACTFVTCSGTPAKFVAKTIIGSLFPGSGPVMDVIEKVIDCVHNTAKDNLEALGSREDLAHIEKMFDLLLGDLQETVEHLRRLEDVPDLARKTWYAALRNEEHCLTAARALQEQGFQLSGMQAELKKQSAGLDELRDLQRRSYGTILDYIEEQRLHHVSAADLDARLKRIEEGIAAVGRGAPERAEPIFADLSGKQPASAALAVAEAASQVAARHFVAAAKTLGRAARLRPGDAKLAEMSRVATKLSQGATPVDPGPDTKKRPQPGDTLDGWLLEQLLGFGGWGQVFLARKGADTRALKIMHAELSQDAEFVRRFKREMGTLLGLGAHPHLVHIDPDHLFGRADDWNCWYYVMEHIEGTTLERYLQQRGPLNLGQARTVFTGIAEGLAVVHVRGIIHRDIKPANILLRKETKAGQGCGVPVDFGLAGLVDAHTRGAGYTALFAAPEQFRHGDSDCRSDVYALAATIYYCLLYNDANKRGRFKAELLPAEVTDDVRALLKRCLDNDPDERPKDAAAFVQAWSKPKVVEVFTPPPPRIVTPTERKSGEILPNSLGMKFAWCPSGSFLMGSPTTEESRSDDETQHRVTLSKGFYMGITPVTQAQWQGVMGSNPSNFKGDDKPVEQVSWDDCQTFCNKLEQKDGKRYRLPTEAEWEYACRAGTTTPFHFGNTISTNQANYDGNYTYGRGTKGVCRQQTTPVGSFPANAWRLFDMHGNILEWCQDWYGPYPSSDIKDPQGVQKGDPRLLRGGSWFDFPRACRSAYRCGRAPSFRNEVVGCRVVLCLD